MDARGYVIIVLSALYFVRNIADVLITYISVGFCVAVQLQKAMREASV